MARDIRTPEWVLEELCETGRRWLAARARQRRHGPAFGEASVGDQPAAYLQPEETEAAAAEGGRLRARFLELVREFVERADQE